MERHEEESERKKEKVEKGRRYKALSDGKKAGYNTFFEKDHLHHPDNRHGKARELDDGRRVSTTPEA